MRLTSPFVIRLVARLARTLLSLARSNRSWGPQPSPRLVPILIRTERGLRDAHARRRYDR